MKTDPGVRPGATPMATRGSHFHAKGEIDGLVHMLGGGPKIVGVVPTNAGRPEHARKEARKTRGPGAPSATGIRPTRVSGLVLM